MLSVEDTHHLREKGYESQVMEAVYMGWDQEAAQKLVGSEHSTQCCSPQPRSLGNVQVVITRVDQLITGGSGEWPGQGSGWAAVLHLKKCPVVHSTQGIMGCPDPGS